jgi:hypothetical protein
MQVSALALARGRGAVTASVETSLAQEHSEHEANTTSRRTRPVLTGTVCPPPQEAAAPPDPQVAHCCPARVVDASTELDSWVRR